MLYDSVEAYLAAKRDEGKTFDGTTGIVPDGTKLTFKDSKLELLVFMDGGKPSNYVGYRSEEGPTVSYGTVFRKKYRPQGSDITAWSDLLDAFDRSALTIKIDKTNSSAIISGVVEVGSVDAEAVIKAENKLPVFGDPGNMKIYKKVTK